jgi:uncharacterized membrane protein HdeD (DUF308 family)
MVEKNSLMSSIATELHEIHHSRGWFLALGIALIVLGAVCLLGEITATFATVLAIGWLLLIAAVFALIHAVRTHTWGGFFLHLLSAVLRGVTGFLLLRYPLAGALTITLFLASFFIVGGIFRAVGAGVLRFPRWGWATFSGIVSVALGVMLFWQLPASSVWFLGLAVGIDFIFDGTSLVALGLALRGAPALQQPAGA